MFDRELVIDLLAQLEEACERAVSRLRGIANAGDLLDPADDRLRLDATAMVLIAIGEQVKSIEKRVPVGFLASHPEVDWAGAKAMRDRISHDYFGIDPEVVFITVRRDIPLLMRAASAMKADLEAQSGPA